MSEKRDNQRDKILVWLQMRGERGVLNTELTELCMRFGARIYELRKAGHDIKTVKLDESRYRFVLEEGSILPSGRHGPQVHLACETTHGGQNTPSTDFSHAVQERLFA